MDARFIRDYKYSILMIIIGSILVLIGIDKAENYLILNKVIAVCLHYIGIGSKAIIMFLIK